MNCCVILLFFPLDIAVRNYLEILNKMLKNERLNFGLSQKIPREVLLAVESPAVGTVSGRRGGSIWVSEKLTLMDGGMMQGLCSKALHDSQIAGSVRPPRLGEASGWEFTTGLFSPKTLEMI